MPTNPSTMTVKEADAKPSGARRAGKGGTISVPPQRGAPTLVEGAKAVPTVRTHGDALRLQRAIGNQVVRRFLQPSTVTVQRAVKGREIGQQNTESHGDLASLCKQFGLRTRDLIRPIKDQLVRAGLLPESYSRGLRDNPALQLEFQSIMSGLDTLIAAANSRMEITAPKNDANAVAAQLFAILRPSLTAAHLGQYTEYRRIAAVGEGGAARYLAFLQTVSARLNNYNEQIDLSQFSDEARAKNARMQNRIDSLTTQSSDLMAELDTAIAAGSAGDVLDEIIGRIDALAREVEILEHAWDLDFGLADGSINEDLDVLAQNEAFEGHYKAGGGSDDDMSVGEVFQPQLACSLYSILALKGTWLGTNNPAELHAILRKTGQLKDYDDNRAAAKVRYLAGLTPTIVGDQNLTVPQYIASKKAAKETDSFIVDAKGMAHTFAAVWKDGDYRKVDDTGSNGSFGGYRENKVLAVWK